MTTHAVVLWMEANRMFSAGQFLEAVSKFGEYIQKLVEENAYPARLAIAYSSRAEAWLQLKQYSEALMDTQRALELYPHHAQSLLRKAVAYQGLAFFEEAAATFEAFLSSRTCGVNSAAVTLFPESSRRMEREDKLEKGIVEDESLLPAPKVVVSTADLEADLEFQNFVGPVELRKTPTMGRGLFATRDVQAGELLLVGNCLLSITERQGESTHESRVRLLKEGLEKMRMESFCNIQDFRSLQLLVQMDTLAGPHLGNPNREIPLMRYFTPLNALSPVDKVVSRSDLHHPSIQAQFTEQLLLKQHRLLDCHTTREGYCISKFYVLPALMNRSCLPNVSVTTLPVKGFPKILRASQHVRRGEEFFFPSDRIFCPWEERRELVEGFYCRCHRCIFEERLLQRFPILKDMQTQGRHFWDQREMLPSVPSHLQSAFKDQCLHCISSVNSLFQEDPELAALTTTQKAWIKCTFIRLYVLLLINPASRRDKPVVKERMLILDAVTQMKYVDPASFLALCMCAELIDPEMSPSLLHYDELDVLLEEEYLKPRALELLTLSYGTNKDQGLEILPYFKGWLKAYLHE